MLIVFSMGIEEIAEKADSKVSDSLGKFAFHYMVNRGSSNRELVKMIKDNALVWNAISAFSKDATYLKEQGFTDEEINSLGGLRGAAALSYNSDFDKDEFISQFRRQMAEGYSTADDYEKLETKVTKGIDWEKVRSIAGKAAVAAVYVGGAFLGAALLAPQTAKAIDTWHFDLPADFDYNGIVDTNDLKEFADNWLTPGYISDEYGPGVDINADGIVNLIDFAHLANYWQQSANPTRISVMATQITSEEGDQYHPCKRTWLEVHNDSPIDTDYEITYFHVARGLNEFDSVDYLVDWSWTIPPSGPNELLCETTNPLYFLDPGSSRNGFQAKSDANDPNDLIFSDVEVQARADIGGYSLPVKVPLPEKK